VEQDIHEKEFREWREALERHRGENPSCPTFEELDESAKKPKHM
jgi:hypothetical protein